MTAERRLNVRLPAGLHTAALAYAAEHGVTVSDLVRDALEGITAGGAPSRDVELSAATIEAVAERIAEILRERSR